jgi:hypothetical protein
MALAYEQPLNGFAADIGGSAGPGGTHGGTDVQRPAAMPSKADCDHVVTRPDDFVDTVTKDEVSIYVDGTIDLTEHVRNNGGIQMGSGVTLVGAFCDPSVPGRGSVIRTDAHTRYLLTSCYGKAPSVWGISFEGPEPESVDLDHTSKEFEDRTAGALFCYDDNGTFRVYGCEFRFWSLAGVLCGAKNHTTKTVIERCTFVDGLFEHLGYGVEHYNGFLSVRKCFFDKLRHAISSFGYPNGGYAVAESVFGPGPWRGHLVDMHCLDNNLDNGDRTAGEFVRVFRCSSLITGTARDDVNGYDQEFVAIRGEPVKTSYVDKSHLHHDGPPDPTGYQGSAWRQETEWSDTPDEWLNFEPRDNHFGESFRDGYGAPRADGGTDSKPDTEPQPEKPTMDTLLIHGHDVKTNYSIRVDGRVEIDKRSDKEESIQQNDDGTITLSGTIVGYNDSFRISDDATLLEADVDGPMSVSRNENPVDLGMLAMLGEDDSTDVDKLRQRVASIESTLSAISSVFSK